MTDVLLILPPLGPPDFYIKPEKELDLDSYKWKTRLTRVPQGLLSIGTVLYNLGYRVDILDCRLHYTNGREHFLDVLKKKSKDVRLLIGISLMTAQIPCVLEIIDTIRQINSNIHIVLGGIHPTLYPKQTCKDDSVDFVIVGDGEYPMAELVKSLDKGGLSYKDIKGLTYRENHHIISNPIGKPFDIRGLGVPAYHLLEMKNYLAKIPFYLEKKTIGLEYNSSRGCPYNCSFCVNNILPQNRIWRYKTADQVIEDLHILKDKYRFNYLFFEEENPFTNMSRTFEIAEKLIKDDFNIHYCGNVRADVVVKTPKNILKTMKESGWCETSIGIESGSNKVLSYLRKNITVDQVIPVAKILDELGIYALYSFMMFLPYENSVDRELTYALMKEIKITHPNSEFIGPQPYRPYPGSDLYKDCLGEGLKEPKSLREWSNFVTERGDMLDMPWVKDFSFVNKLKERYFRYLKEYGLKKTSERAVELIIGKIIRKENKDMSW